MGIFCFEDENDPTKLKFPDWSDKDGVPTRFGRVYSWNEYLKNWFECYTKSETDICKKSILKRGKDENYYVNEYDIEDHFIDEKYKFKYKYLNEIKSGNFDKIPDVE